MAAAERLQEDFRAVRAQEDEVVSDLRQAKPQVASATAEGAGDAEVTDLWLARWRASRPLLRVRALAHSEAMLPRTNAFHAFLAAVLFFLIAAGLAVADEALGSSERANGPTATISYVDVGQGDGVVIRIGTKIIVSDAGELNPQSVDNELHRLGAVRIDVAILTHPHKTTSRTSSTYSTSTSGRSRQPSLATLRTGRQRKTIVC
jgi:hypothetical protein